MAGRQRRTDVRMTRSAWFAGATLLLFGVGCSHDAPATGTIKGVVRVYGGPAVVVDGKVTMALNGSPGPEQAVTVSRDSKPVATASTDERGQYSLQLAPGRYAIRACGPDIPVIVTSGHTTTVDLRCDVP